MTKEELLKQLGFNEYKKQQFSCEACRIEHDDEQGKQKPAHTCGIDGPIPDISELKADVKKQQPTDPNAAYNAKVMEVAEILARAYYDELYSTSYWDERTIEFRREKIYNHMSQARAMVAEMAKTFEQAYFLNLLHDPSDPVFNVWHEQCDRIMQERGLIPNTKTNKDESISD